MSVHRGYAAVSFGQMHYRYAGTPGKPVIVLLHQTPSTSEMYEDLMNELSSDFRLIAPDTPGMGMSDPLDGQMTIAGLADGIAEFLDELGIDSCCVFGHHTGASIAAELASRHKNMTTAVALCGPTLLDDELRAKMPHASAVFPVEQDGGHMQKMWQRISGKDTDAPAAIILREATSGLLLGDAYPGAYDAVVAQDFAAVVSGIDCPALVFAGTEDILFGAVDGTFELLKHGSKATIDGARGFVCETHCEEVAGLLREFFPAEVAA